MEAPDWPPGHLKKDDSVSVDEAMEVIANGAPIFKGFRSAIPNVPGDYFNFYAIADEVPGDGYDSARMFHPAFALCSFLFSGHGMATLPWQTLEQPSLAFSYGSRPGTITLNHWVGLYGFLDPVFDFIEPAIKLRSLELETILARLRYLEGGFEEDYPDLMYQNLYGNSGILKDPDRYLRPHKAIERQIADLITVLGRKDWIDFSRAENWVVGKLFKDVRMGDRGKGYRFFHQLLISMELDVRICSKLNDDAVRQKLMAQLPAPIAYSVAVARRWREGVRIHKFEGGDEDERIKFSLSIKKQQLKSIRKFARTLKWKNLEEVESALEHRKRDLPRVEERSSDAMTYVSGVILPGRSLPWLLMNVLIDCDSETDHELDALTYLHPHSGFQYKGSTYWSSLSIVGKVLAPTAQEVGGWVGPCVQTGDLKRTEVARLRQRPPRLKLEVKDIRTMEIRSDHLGPESSQYPLDEYEMVLPDTETIGDSVKIEKLTFQKVSRTPKGGEEGRTKDPQGTFVYDAGIQFAIDGQSWPVRLNFNTEYISAVCSPLLPQSLPLPITSKHTSFKSNNNTNTKTVPLHQRSTPPLLRLQIQSHQRRLRPRDQRLGHPQPNRHRHWFQPQRSQSPFQLHNLR